MILGFIVSAMLATPLASSQPIAAETLVPPRQFTYNSPIVQRFTDAAPACAYIRAFIYSSGLNPRFEREVTCVPLKRQGLKKAHGTVHVVPIGTH